MSDYGIWHCVWINDISRYIWILNNWGIIWPDADKPLKIEAHFFYFNIFYNIHHSPTRGGYSNVLFCVFQALGSLYFIHQSVQNVQIYDFKGKLKIHCISQIIVEPYWVTVNLEICLYFNEFIKMTYVLFDVILGAHVCGMF